MNSTFVHLIDIDIERTKDVFGRDIAELWDCDGNKLWTFPGEVDDRQIVAAIEFANHAFSLGVEVGERNKTRAIKACLGIA